MDKEIEIKIKTIEEKINCLGKRQDKLENEWYGAKITKIVGYK